MFAKRQSLRNHARLGLPMCTHDMQALATADFFRIYNPESDGGKPGWRAIPTALAAQGTPSYELTQLADGFRYWTAKT